MTRDDIADLACRAEQEAELAQRATIAAVVAHYRLSTVYLDRLHGHHEPVQTMAR